MVAPKLAPKGTPFVRVVSSTQFSKEIAISFPDKIVSLRKDYKTLRNKITDEKRNSKKAHFTEKFSRIKDNSAKIWKEIRSLVNIKSSKSSSIKILDENHNILSDSQKIANIFVFPICCRML